MEELEVWEKLIAEWLGKLPSEIAKLNTVLLEKLYTFIDNIDPSLTLGENLTSLLQVQTQLPVLIQSVGFGIIVTQIADKIAETLTKLETYFQTVFGESEKTAALTDVFRASLARVRGSLLGEGISQALTTELVKTLQYHVYSKSTKAIFRQALGQVLGVNGQPVRYLTTYANDTLYQFSRAYTDEVTKGLDAQYFYYMGTSIKTTRDFCGSRVGKVFTKMQVKDWAKLDWKGKIQGTTAQSIFMYAGGYNCRHRILPISKELSEKMKY